MLKLQLAGVIKKLANIRRSGRTRDHAVGLDSPGGTDYYTKVFGEMRWAGESGKVDLITGSLELTSSLSRQRI